MHNDRAATHGVESDTVEDAEQNLVPQTQSLTVWLDVLCTGGATVQQWQAHEYEKITHMH